jgi:hypothetical protein
MSLRYTTPEAVMAYLEARVRLITGVNTVERQRAERFENFEYPSAFINDVRRDRQVACYDLTKVTHTFAVIVFTRLESNMITGLNALVENAVTNILADPKCGGLTYSFDVTRVDTDSGVLHPLAAAIIMVEAVYLTRN